MRTILVRYRTRPDQSDTNDALVRAVFDELATGQHPGFRYACLRAGDDVVHVAALDDGAVNPLPGLASFAAFHAELDARCEVAPTAADATLVGSYRCIGPAADDHP